MRVMVFDCDFFRYKKYMNLQRKFPTPETLGRMGASVGRRDVWDRLGGRALGMISG